MKKDKTQEKLEVTEEAEKILETKNKNQIIKELVTYYKNDLEAKNTIAVAKILVKERDKITRPETEETKPENDEQ